MDGIGHGADGRWGGEGRGVTQRCPSQNLNQSRAAFDSQRKRKQKSCQLCIIFLHILGAHMNWQKTCTVGARKNMLLVYYVV